MFHGIILLFEKEIPEMGGKGIRQLWRLLWIPEDHGK